MFPLLGDSPLLRAARDVCRSHAVRAWLVGGSVRDALLSRTIHDFDFAVEYDAIAIARAVGDRLDAPMYVLDAERDTGRVIAHDASGARVLLDFAALRGPTIEVDLALRDFTVNAIAIDLAQPDALIDPFGGRRDVEDGLVRAVGEHSLSDDPVRMLRAARMSMALAFRLDRETARQIRESNALIRTVSAERVRDELAQIVGLPGSYRNLRGLDELGLIAGWMPELPDLRGVTQSPPHHWDVLEHTLRGLDMLEVLLGRAAGIALYAGKFQLADTAPEWAWPEMERSLEPLKEDLHEHLNKPLADERPAWLTLKWAALYHDVAKPHTRSVDPDGRIRFLGHEGAGADVAAYRLRRLRFSVEETRRVETIIRYHMRPHHLFGPAQSLTRRAVYRFYQDTGAAGVEVLLFALADHLATHGPHLDRDGWARRLECTRALLDEYFHRREETVSPLPLITGHDVMSVLGLKPGPQIGRVLEAVREAQAAGEVKTREEALAFAQAMKG